MKIYLLKIFYTPKIILKDQTVYLQFAQEVMKNLLETQTKNKTHNNSSTTANFKMQQITVTVFCKLWLEKNTNGLCKNLKIYNKEK